MPSRKNKLYYFLAVWDIFGLESLFDIEQVQQDLKKWEHEKTIAILKDERFSKKSPGIPVQLLILRAKFNTQRQYEIYQFTSTLNYSEVKKVFETDPQTIVDFIRKNGHKVYSDKTTLKQLVY